VARGDDIEERLIEFAVRLSRVGDALSGKPADTHSGTIVAVRPFCFVLLSAPAFKRPPGDAQLTIQQFNNSTIQQLIIASPPQLK
jgi:hypothetical protein